MVVFIYSGAVCAGNNKKGTVSTGEHLKEECLGSFRLIQLVHELCRLRFALQRYE